LEEIEMAKIHGRNASIYLEDTAGASTAFTCVANSATLSMSIDAPEVTTFCDNTIQNLAGGIQDFEFSMDGFTDEPGATACDARAIIQNGGGTLLQYGWAGGSTTACPKATACVVLTEFSMENPVDGAATFSLTCVPRSGSLTLGAWA
jgi:hypothetical protein